MANEKVVVVPGIIRVHLCPKVASASLYKAFHQEKRSYLAPAEANGGEYRFLPVRHPLDRLVSLYAYFCLGTGLNGQPQVAKLGYEQGMPFETFLGVIFERHWENIHTRKQVEFSKGHDIDQYAPFERLQLEWDAMRRVFPDLKVMRVLPYKHKTSHKPWQEYYDKHWRKRAEQEFAADLALYEKGLKNGEG